MSQRTVLLRVDVAVGGAVAMADRDVAEVVASALRSAIPPSGVFRLVPKRGLAVVGRQPEATLRVRRVLALAGTPRDMAAALAAVAGGPGDAGETGSPQDPVPGAPAAVVAP